MNYQQDNRMDLLALVEFAYKNAQHASTHVSLFLVTYGFYLCVFPLTIADSPLPAATDFLQELTAMHQVLKEQLKWAKEVYKKLTNLYCQDVAPLVVGDHVWLSTWNLSMIRPSCKPDHRLLGLFPV